MGQIRSFDDALDFLPEQKRGLKGRLHAVGHAVHLTWDALIESYAASRRYRELVRHGMSHEKAATAVFSDHYRH